MNGLVVKNTGSWYEVKTDDLRSVVCKIKGNFRLKNIRTTNPIAVGDLVTFVTSTDGTGLITEIHDRKNYIIRKSSNLSRQSHIIAANVDLALLIATINYPETSTTFIDRFIAGAEAYNVPTCIVINKMDLYNDHEVAYAQAIKSLYETIGYKVFLTSSKQTETLEQVTDFLQDKTTLISGNSGVGKSTLINIISPLSMAKTGEISAYHNKGMHTTTFSEMFQLEKGGYLIDTPGIKGFGVVDMEYEEIGHFFKEIFAFSKNCKFNNCSHIHEPGCAVINALENHQISQSRYNSYTSMLSDFETGKYR